MRMRGTLIVVVLACGAGFSTGGTLADARVGTAGLCFGTLHVSPARLHAGDRLHLRGTHFHCPSPNGKLLPEAGVVFYRPGTGFTVYSVHVRANGTYRATVRIPRRLMAARDVLSGGKATVATRPGTYYLAIRLFDVSMPPINEALARVKIVM